MNIVLINMILLPAAILVALPVLVHLFARTRPPRYRFSSIEFILRIVRTTLKLKRPQDWLLLLIRTIMFFALVFMFLRPLLFSQRRLAGHMQKKNVVVIVDATASMGYIDGAQTRFAAACAEASEVLSGLSSRDFANIIWLDSSPDAAFPEMGTNLRYLQDILRRAKVTNEAGNIEEAVRMAVKLIGESEGKHEVCVISDFQESAWSKVEISMPEDVDLICIKVGEADSANGAVSDIVCDPAAPLAGEEATIFCEVHNYSSQPRRRTVFLQVGESRQAQDLLIPAWNKTMAVFKHTFRAPGTVPVKATLSDDIFTGDDRRVELVRVKEFLMAAVLPGSSDDGQVWLKVLDALGWIRTKKISSADLQDSSDYDVLLLPGWDGQNASHIRSQLEKGCTVFCSFSRSVKHDNLMKLAGVSDLSASEEVLEWREGDRAMRLKVAAVKNSIFELFAGGEHGDPAAARVRGRYEIPEDLLKDAEILIKYDDGMPAIMQVRNRGTMFLWNVPLSQRYSDWARRVEFLPLFAEMILASRALSDQGAGIAVYPGEQIVWEAASDTANDDVVLKNPSGKTMDFHSRPTEAGVSFVSEQTKEFGLYTWEYQTQASGLSVVCFPEIESDLRSMSVEEVEAGDGVVLNGGSKLRQLRDGLKLWPYLLVIVLSMVVFECVVLVWSERK